MKDDDGFIPGRRKTPVNIQRLIQPIKKQRIEKENNDSIDNVKIETIDQNLTSSNLHTSTSESIKISHITNNNLKISDFIDLTSPVNYPIELSSNLSSSLSSSSSSDSSDFSDSDSNSPQSKSISSANKEIIIPTSSILNVSNLKSINNNESDNIIKNVIPAVANLTSGNEVIKTNTSNQLERSSSIFSDSSFLSLRKRSGSDIQKEVTTMIKTKEDKESSDQWRQRLWPSKAQVNI